MSSDITSSTLAQMQQLWQLHHAGALTLTEDAPADDALAAQLRGIAGQALWLVVEHEIPEDTDAAKTTLDQLAALYQDVSYSKVQANRLTNELIVAWDRLSFLHKSTLLMRDMKDVHDSCKQILKLAQQTLTMESGFIAYAQESGFRYDWINHPFSATYYKVVPALLHDPHVSLRLPSQTQCAEVGLPELQCFIGQQLPTKNGPTTYIGLYNDRFNHELDAGDIQIFESLSEQITTMLESYALFQEQMQMQRINHDLSIAGDVQQSFLPKTLPELTGYDIRATLVPADRIGGDFYDTLQTRASTAVILCDVAGKGIPAALLAAEIRTAIRLQVGEGHPIDEVLTHANATLYNDLLNAERFATVMIASYDAYDEQWSYSNAGHTTGLVFRAADMDVERLSGTALPLGIVPDEPSDMEHFTMQVDDVLLLYSDGLSEAENSAGGLFGIDGIMAVVRCCQSAPAATIKRVLLEAYEQHIGDERGVDDLTLLVVKRDDAIDEPPPALYWRFPSDLTELATLQQATDPLLAHLPESDASAEWLMEVQLMLTEIVSNIIRHGYEEQDAGIINGLLQLRADHIRIDIIDKGAPYEIPETLPELNVFDLPEGGYGLHIIRNIADEFTYTRLADGTNHWHIIRHLPE